MTQLATIYPSRITITPARVNKSIEQKLYDKFIKEKLGLSNDTYKKNFKLEKNSFTLSKSSKKKLMDSINGMFVLSNPRTVKMKSGKSIFNFKMSFVTLTLPSKQVHNDTFVKKELLNQLLVELRNKYGVKNYVWKAELQKNKNIHFHLILDKYVDFQALRRRWNRITEKHNYVTKYSEKMQSLSLLEYHKSRNRFNSTSFEDSKKAFAQGTKCNWSNPNSVDVRSVSNKKDLAIYLSKYVTKPVTKSSDLVQDIEREINFGRSWSRSYSLAQLKYKNKFTVEDLKDLIEHLEAMPEKVLKVVGDFFQVYYFNISNIGKHFGNLIQFYLRKNAEIYNYPFP
jgi:hypothetical protein|tara:strand:+ start:2977 stop:3999 length:1023 start_codon:yes stop_codon:yes gene_type:complete